MLHVTNGDCAIESLRSAAIQGEFLSWLDVLHEGPVPALRPIELLAPIRARFLADQGWGNYQETFSDFERRDLAIRDFERHSEIVLWFEHDLFDQLQLIQVLDFFSSVSLGETRISLAQSDDYLGVMTAEPLLELFNRRRVIDPLQLNLAVAAWSAFTSPTPLEIQRLLAAGASQLPYLEAALRRHLEQFPSVFNGLSRSEHQALEAIAGGHRAPERAFLACHAAEEAVFMGDTIFAGYLERMSRTRVALLAFEGGEPITAPRGGDDRASFWERPMMLTAAGERVLAGEADAIALNGIDRWLGGVHLTDVRPPWRWNGSLARVEML